MAQQTSSLESATAESTYELLILHTDEAQEWAAYLQQILKSSHKFNRESILLYTVSPADRLHGYNFAEFQSCKCIVLLLTTVFLDILFDHELHGALQRLLYPPHRVVPLLCGVSEDDIFTESFEDWPLWRKLNADDDPALYVSTILESITDSRQEEAECETDEKLCITAASSTESPTMYKTEGVVKEEEKQTVLEDRKSESTENSTGTENSSTTHLTCLTVQPARVLCGEPETLFIIFSTKVHYGLEPEVEFSSENTAPKRVRANVENEYTISVAAPDMPAGVTSLTLYTDQSRVRLKPVTFYTSMGEVSRYLEEAADPVNFICQAFDFTSNATESLDIVLTDSLKSKMPESGFQLFGIRQIEENKMSAYQRDEEFPTLLHFAARYGLKKLTSVLLQCPGALQAYSVVNKNGDYPNTLAEKSGFSDLRHFMDKFVETEDTLESHCEDNTNVQNDAEVYEPMSNVTQDNMIEFSGCSEDIYESMVGINPECAEDLYEVMNAVNENPEEALLRTFFQAKPQAIETPVNTLYLQKEEEEKDESRHFVQLEEEEEDPYNICPEDIYDTVDTNNTYGAAVLNRPPAPIPRPESESEPEKPVTYIHKVFSEKRTAYNKTMETEYNAAQPVDEPPSSTYDPYAGMKTPGQRQLISLQERVKVGEITVEEAVQEFKAWQFDHERRASSLRYQQENIKKLRDSITRRHKEREKLGKEIEYEISAPLKRNSYGVSSVMMCDVYEPAPRMISQPPPTVPPLHRGSWKTGSTSSTSSTESNRLSCHSTFSYSSGTEPEFEDAVEILPPPPRPPRPFDSAPVNPSPRIPPRIPERSPEVDHERYISCPTRPLPQRPSNRHTDSAPPVPRRLR